MTHRAFAYLLAVCLIAGLLYGCGSPESKMLGHWVSPKESNEINISKNSDAYIVELISGGDSVKCPATYKDGTLTLQNASVGLSFQYDDKTDELVAYMNGQEDRMQRK